MALSAITNRTKFSYQKQGTNGAFERSGLHLEIVEVWLPHNPYGKREANGVQLLHSAVSLFELKPLSSQVAFFSKIRHRLITQRTPACPYQASIYFVWN